MSSMKWILVYTANYVVFVAELDAKTRPLFNPDTYTMREFDTEAEMLQYIEDNDLEIVEVEDVVANLDLNIV